MKQIAILAMDNAIGSNLMGVQDSFDFANSFLHFRQGDDQKTQFETRVYSADGSPVKCSNGTELPCLPLEELLAADIYIPCAASVRGSKGLQDFLESIQPFLPILRRGQEQGAWLASHCTGSFVLAEAGVLDNKQATTSWWMKEVFAKRYPKVKLTLDELVVQDHGVVTAGATTSYINLCLKLVELFVGAELTSAFSKLLVMDRHRLPQHAFMEPELIVGKRDKVVANIQQWMHQHYNSAISLDQICDEFAITKRTLIRRFKAATGETPLAHLQFIRVTKAKRLLENTDLPVENIVEKVGYEDLASFRKLFQTRTHLTPKAYRDRFSLQY